MRNCLRLWVLIFVLLYFSVFYSIIFLKCLLSLTESQMSPMFPHSSLHPAPPRPSPHYCLCPGLCIHADTFSVKWDGCYFSMIAAKGGPFSSEFIDPVRRKSGSVRTVYLIYIKYVHMPEVFTSSSAHSRNCHFPGKDHSAELRETLTSLSSESA